jgi:hypothetical protein
MLAITSFLALLVLIAVAHFYRKGILEDII